MIRVKKKYQKYIFSIYDVFLDIFGKRDNQGY